jgi:hypothetical protein
MPQNINLNVSPYFDDFSESKNYQRVLFKPGTPIQARELTTLQSILQNQVEKFGKHFFKEGSMVIPGQIAFDQYYTCVQIDDIHLGIPVVTYLSSLVGKTIKGEISGVTAKVENYISNTESEKGNYTLYIKYQSSSDVNFDTKTFVDGENLISLEDINYGISTIRANTTFATTLISNSSNVGSAAKITEGVYFLRGFFVTVPSQTVILDQYSNTPSYRVGLLINEEISVATNSNPDLFDNAQGFSNFAAPGADRLKITATLIKKELNDFNDEDFVEILRTENGVLQKFVNNSQYNLIREELARRTYDESGDYYVRPFTVNVKESLNNKVGNNGIYEDNDQTKQGNVPSDNLGCLTISPGKAFIRGYEVETIDTTIIDFEKPRSTEKLSDQSIPFSVGRQILLNNVFGSVPVGFGTTSQVSLYSGRTSTPGQSSGSKIGVARVYDLKLRNAEYTGPETKFECSLYDIQTYTVLTLNTTITQSAPCLIQGKNSGSSGYLVSNVSNSSQITLYQVSGSFQVDEQIQINGIDNGRIITNIRDYGLTDVHQIVANESIVGVGTFTADPVLNNQSLLSEPGTQFTISATSGGISTVSTSNQTFLTQLKVGDIVSYTKQGQSIPTYNSISAIDTTNRLLSLSATTNVVGVSSGALPSSLLTANDFKKVSLEVTNIENSYLYSALNRDNISNLDLLSSNLVIKKSYNITVSSNVFNATLETDPNLSLEPFDEEDYNLTYVRTGKVETLDNQKLTPSGRTVSLSNLSENGNAILTVTYRKVNPKLKTKTFVQCSSIIVDRSSSTSSGIGTTTLNDGLTYSSVYGIRVQDKEVCLNVPDVVSIVGVFESSGISDPVLPKITFESLNSNVTNFVQGEQLVGQTSGAVASYVTNNGTNEVDIVYLNENTFILNETVISKTTNISGVVNSLTYGNNNIKENFILDNGQRPEYYDYSRLIRKKEFSAPTKKLKIIFNHYVIDSTSDGDFVGADSYDKSRYTKDIPSIDGIRNTDIIDLRPRVSGFNPISSSRSPFEFQSRIFDLQLNSSTNIFAKDKNVILSYDYYLPRVDKLFLTKDGTFTINTGVPSLSPKSPNSLDSALEIATIYYPAYLYSTKDVKVSFASHKRYTMKDISRIEDRLANVEYYTSLSLLETDTKNLVIRDPQTGLDKFKCGFFVDNFKSYLGGDISNPSYKSSVDSAYGILRPQHYTTSVDLILGSEAVVGVGTTSNPSVDLRFATDLGSPDVRRVGDVVCLNYVDTVYIENKFATRTENINPFNTPSWIGSVELNPTTDTWIETRRSERVEDIEGSFTSAMQQLGVDSNTGLSPINWGSWETNWTGASSVQGPSLLRIQDSRLISDFTSGNFRNQVFQDTVTDFRNSTVTTTTNQSRQGIQFGVSERFDTTSLGDRVVSRSVITLMRSRNIEFVAKRLKPSSRFYAFFDNINMNNYIIPKLLEISMVSGTFQEGETVVGLMPSSASSGARSIRFRLARQNHKYGPYNNPSEVYTNNPYNPSSIISSSYSSTTNIVNIDTASLEIQSVSQFFGSVLPSMQLVGQTSNAVATVSDIRLISDSAGTVIGSLFIPDPTLNSNPSFESGTKTFVLTTSSTNSNISGVSDSLAESNFTSSGTIDNVENVTLRIRNAEIERNIRNENRTLTETEERLVAETSTNNRLVQSRIQTRWVDPLAQSFEVTDSNGIYITKCDIFFRTKDSGDIPVTLQIRTMENGLPSQSILPFGEVVLGPSDISVSEDASVATTFTFPSPVFLESPKSYCVVLISNSDSYNVWISRMTEADITSINRPESERIIVSQQPLLGSLFKSQNGATWDPSQLEDLKFKLYRANFTSTSGSVRFYNPDLNVGNRQIASLRPNPILSYSKRILVGLGKSLTSSEVTNLTPGTTIYQNNYPNFSGNLESVVGAIGINQQLSITNAGSAYTSTFVYLNKDLVTLSGRGYGAKVNLTVSNGVAVAATVSIGGTGYAIGDTLTVNASNTGGFGKNLVLSIPNNSGIISAFNSLIISNVQDNIDSSGTSNEIIYVGTGGTTLITGATVKYKETLSDGLHFKVSHNNHGMYSDQDRVTLYDISSDVPPQKLVSDYSSTSTDPIQLDSVAPFTIFENVLVSPNNPGFIKIGTEVIRYTGFDVPTNTLTGITRNIDSTIVNILPIYSIGRHLSGSPVFKYEFNGVSLRRINKTHLLSDADNVTYPNGLDYYNIKVNMGSVNGNIDRDFGNPSGYPQLFFRESKTGGSYNSNLVSTNSIYGPKASQNIVFNILRPNVQTLLPETTSIDAKIRTFTGSSINGSEVPFMNQGFESISLNSNNTFKNTRAIYSRVNESNNLQSYPGYKSLTMELSLSTKDTKVSPMIDLDRVNLVSSMNRIDQPVANLVTDPRVNSLYDDPHSAIYVSKIVRLEKNSDSLKVIFDAFRDQSNDIRVLYRLLRNDTPDSQQLYEFFPGYDNLDTVGNVINPKNNSGRPDKLVQPSTLASDYSPYEYSAKNLPLFNGFQIKIIMIGTNQSVVPKIKDLRVIASI